MDEISTEVRKNKWKIFEHEIPFSRGFPKLMRGNMSYLGNAYQFRYFAKEFFDGIDL
jgi:chromosome partitioning protein